MTGVPALSRIGPCDAVFVSAHEGEAALSAAARLAAERRRGRRTLIVNLFRAPQEEAEPGGVSLGMADAASRPGYAELREALFGRPAVQDESLGETVALLDEIFRRTQARQIYLPLGVGGHVDHRITHEAGLRALPLQPGRDIFFYEERPEALVPGAVRMRLGQLGARLPPGAVRVAREGGLARLLLRYQRIPHRREAWHGVGERVRLTRLLASAWWESRAWQPQRAFGVRVQPVLQEAEDMDAVLAAVRAFDERRGSPAGARERLLRLSADYARRLGGRGWSERYWLLLPAREGADKAA
jgi:LmbE family N-acetylglucosaminyl deacetylase